LICGNAASRYDGRGGCVDAILTERRTAPPTPEFKILSTAGEKFLILRRVPRDTDGGAVGGMEGDEVGVGVDVGEGVADGGVDTS
jgi:hypothetical protein